MSDVDTAGGAALLGPTRIVYYNTRGSVSVQDIITGETLETVARPVPVILSPESSIAASADGQHYVVGSFPLTQQMAAFAFAYLYQLGTPHRITDIKFFDNTDAKRPLICGNAVAFVDLRDEGYALTPRGLYHFHVQDGGLRLSLDAKHAVDVARGLETVGRTAAHGPWVVCVMSGSPNRLFWWNHDTRQLHTAVVAVGAVSCMLVTPDGYVLVWGSKGHYVAHPHRPPVRMVSTGRRLPALGCGAAYRDTVQTPWAKLRLVLLGNRQPRCVLSWLPMDVLRMVLGHMCTIRFTSLSVPYISLSRTDDTRRYRAQQLCVDPDSGALWVDTQPDKWK